MAPSMPAEHLPRDKEDGLTADMKEATFHGFPKLPPELRIKIWKAACLPRTGRDHGLHYVTIDTMIEEFDWDSEEGYSVTMDPNLEGYDEEFDMENDDTGYITLRAMKRLRKRPTGVQNTTNRPKESAYLWDAGLWMACKESRDVIIEHVDLNGWLKLREDSLGEFPREWYDKNFTSTMVPHKKDKTWRPMVIPCRDNFCIAAGRLSALPKSLYGMNMLAPFLGTRNFTILGGWNIAFKFDNSWNVDFPRNLGKLKRENSQRGLLANWLENLGEMFMNDACNQPVLWIIDDTVGWVTQPGLEYKSVYRDCGGDYVRAHWSATRGDSTSGGVGAVGQFINSLGKLLDGFVDGFMYMEMDMRTLIHLLVRKDNEIPSEVGADFGTGDTTDFDEFEEEHSDGSDDQGGKIHPAGDKNE